MHHTFSDHFNRYNCTIQCNPIQHLCHKIPLYEAYSGQCLLTFGLKCVHSIVQCVNEAKASVGVGADCIILRGGFSILQNALAMQTSIVPFPGKLWSRRAEFLQPAQTQ